MALTKTTIANLALREVGAGRIDDYDQSTPNADIIRDLWDHTATLCLSRHEWTFALKFVSLLRVSDTSDLVGYEYRYQLPVDLLVLKEVHENSKMDRALYDDEYVQRGGFIETNSQSIYIGYVWDNQNVGTWPPWFVDLFVAKLAASIAAPLKSTTERERLEALALQRLRDAKSAESAQQPTMMLPQSRWTQAQHGSVSRRYGPNRW